MRRGEIYWADLGPPAGRRPVLILTRNSILPHLTGIVVAPVSRTVRGIRSEVRLGRREGLRERCAANCDGILTVPRSRMDPEPVGRLGRSRVPQLDDALKFALEITY